MPQVQERAEEFRRVYQSVKESIQQFIVGHEAVIDGVLTGIFTGGHVLLEGVPGLGKTHLVRRCPRRSTCSSGASSSRPT